MKASNQVVNIYDKIEDKIGDLILKQEIVTRELCSRQDHTATGSYIDSNGRPVSWITVFDGHGGDEAIDIIRNADLHTIMQGNSPDKVLQSIIDEECKSLCDDKRYGTGSTFIYAKITFYDDMSIISITNIGDSRAILFVNGEPIFVSVAQDYENAAEIARLMKEDRIDDSRPLVHSSANFDVISSNRIISKHGTYVNFKLENGIKMPLTITQSLGHMGITGFIPDTTKFIIHNTDEFKLFLISDGVSDVIPVDGFMCTRSMGFYQEANSVEQVVNEAEKRWKQQWIHNGTHDLRKPTQSSFPKNGYDDCCCAMLQRTKSKTNIVVPEEQYEDIFSFKYN